MEGRRLDILDVAKIGGIKILSRHGAEYYCKCPFCGTEEKGKFSLTVEKNGKHNVYNCFKCDNGGDMFKLYEEVTGKQFSGPDRIKEIVKSMYKDLGEDMTYTPAVHETHHEEDVKLIPMADDEKLDDVYETILDNLSLDPSHRADLIKRGFSEEEIKDFRFKTLPARFDMRAVEGKNTEGVPGFYEKRSGERSIMYMPGYLCPVWHGKRIKAFTIHTDWHDEWKAGGKKGKEPPKYLWLSSSGKAMGTGTGTPSTCLVGKNPHIVIVTEGILKATCAYALTHGEFTVIGVSGIKSLAGLKDVMEYVPDDAMIYTAYDMDMYNDLSESHENIARLYPDKVAEGLSDKEIIKKESDKNDKIKKAEGELQSFFKDRGFRIQGLRWDGRVEGDKYIWNGRYKGIDDMLLSYNREHFVEFLNYRTRELVKPKASIDENER